MGCGGATLSSSQPDAPLKTVSFNAHDQSTLDKKLGVKGSCQSHGLATAVRAAVLRQKKRHAEGYSWKQLEKEYPFNNLVTKFSNEFWTMECERSAFGQEIIWPNGWTPEDKNGFPQAERYNTEWQLQKMLDKVVPNLGLTVRWLDPEKEMRKGCKSRQHNFQKAMEEQDFEHFARSFIALSDKEWDDGQKIVLERVKGKLRQQRSLLVTINPSDQQMAMFKSSGYTANGLLCVETSSGECEAAFSHLMVLVPPESEDEMDKFVLKNSWGERWGTSGRLALSFPSDEQWLKGELPWTDVNLWGFHEVLTPEERAEDDAKESLQNKEAEAPGRGATVVIASS